MSEMTTDPNPPMAENSDAPSPVFPLHPSIWWALLWCVFMMLVTQVPAGIVALIVMFWMSLRDPIALKDMSSAPIRAGVIVAVLVAHGLITLLAMLCLRMTAGRHWARLVALRPPALVHVLLALCILPAFMAMGSGVEVLLRRIDYPTITKPATAAAFWGAVAWVLFVALISHGLCRFVGGPAWYQRWLGDRPLTAKVLFSIALLGSALLMGVVAYWLLLPIMTDLFPGKPQLEGMDEIMKSFTRMPLWLAVGVIGLVPAISEELWCRAFLGRGLVGRHGVFWGVLLTSFLFGAIHGEPRQATYAMAMGSVLHLVYLASRSLLIPMLLHLLNNSLFVAITRVEWLSALDRGEAQISAEVVIAFFVSAALLMAACLYAFWQTRARPVGIWTPPYPGVVCPPPENETQVVACWPSVGSSMGVLGALGVFVGMASVMLRLILILQ